MRIYLLLAQGDELGMGEIIAIAIGFMIIVGLIVVFGVLFSYFNWWIQSFLTGAKVKIWDLIGMTFRKVRPSIIVPSKIMGVQAGLTDPDITTTALEAHYLAGARVPNVIQALVAAHKAKISLSFREAAAIDLAGRDVLEAVRTSVNPKVIDCPAKGGARRSPVSYTHLTLPTICSV